MLCQFWLLAILATLALGAPMPQGQDTPSLTLFHVSAATSLYNPKKMGFNRANNSDWDLKGKNGNFSSNTTLNVEGTASFSEYSAHDTGVSNNRISGGTSNPKMGFNKANRPEWNLKGKYVNGGANATLSEQGTPSSTSYPAHGTGGDDAGTLGGILGDTSGRIADGTSSHGAAPKGSVNRGSAGDHGRHGGTTNGAVGSGSDSGGRGMSANTSTTTGNEEHH